MTSSSLPTCWVTVPKLEVQPLVELRNVGANVVSALMYNMLRTSDFYGPACLILVSVTASAHPRPTHTPCFDYSDRSHWSMCNNLNRDYSNHSWKLQGIKLQSNHCQSLKAYSLCSNLNHYWHKKPPSIVRQEPWQKLLLLPSSHTIPCAISSGWPKRFIGVQLLALSIALSLISPGASVRGVLIHPGTMALILTSG